ncbi:hypothetical protein Tco_0861776 [Tanacetum coccineum]
MFANGGGFASSKVLVISFSIKSRDVSTKPPSPFIIEKQKIQAADYNGRTIVAFKEELMGTRALDDTFWTRPRCLGLIGQTRSFEGVYDRLSDLIKIFPMAGLAEGLKMLKNRAVLEPPTFKPEFLLQVAQVLISAQGTVSFVADFFLALIEWPMIGMTKEHSGSLNFIASTLNRAERLTIADIAKKLEIKDL